PPCPRWCSRCHTAPSPRPRTLRTGETTCTLIPPRCVFSVSATLPRFLNYKGQLRRLVTANTGTWPGHRSCVGFGSLPVPRGGCPAGFGPRWRVPGLGEGGTPGEYREKC